MKKQKKHPTSHFPCCGRAPRPLRSSAWLCRHLTLCCALWLLPLAKAYCQQPGGIVTAHKNNCVQQWQVDGTRFDGLNISVSDIFGEDEGYFPVGCSGSFYCGRNHLFTTYTNTTSVLHLTNTQYPTLGNLDTFEYIVRFNNTLVPSPGTGTFVSSFANLPNHPLSLNSAAKGQYSIECWYRDPVSGWTMVKSATISVIPKIDRVWVEAPELCSAGFIVPTDNRYHFKIKTSPDIFGTMITAPRYYAGSVYSNTSGCQTAERVAIGIDADALGYTTSGIPTGNPFIVSSIYTVGNASLATPNDNSIRGSSWPYNGTVNTANEDDFYIDFTTSNGNFTLLDYVTGSESGKAVKIEVHITDGVQLDQIFYAPLIIHGTIGGTGNLSAANYTGGYDTNRYTLPAGSAQVWSATSNPIFAQYGNATIPPTLRIRDSLVIPAGTSLTIQGRRLEFGPNGKIIIGEGKSGKDGGYLKLDNTVVTADRTCGNDNQVWQGIQVRGNATKNQATGNRAPAAEWQGTLEMINGSEVSFANTGITNWDGGNASTAGGIINARDSRIYNNKLGVDFAPYSPPPHGGSNNTSIVAPYISNFVNCDFDITQTLASSLNPTLMRGVAVRGVSITGCRFSSTGGGGYVTGIRGTDFGVNVNWYISHPYATPVYTTFNGLLLGLDLRSAGLSGNAPRVAHSQFNTRSYGISSAGVQVPAYTDNQFTVAPFSVVLPAYGIGLTTGSSYMITRNSFTGKSTTSPIAGVAIKNAGSSAASVFVNTYDGLYAGNLSNNLNQGTIGTVSTGLQFLCNAYSNNSFAEAARGSNPNMHGMSKSQGSQSLSAGNTFSGNTVDLYNPASEVVPITYWYDNGANKHPTNTVGGIGFNASSTANDCNYSDGTLPLGSTGGYVHPRTGSDPIVGLKLAHNVGYALNDSTGSMNKDSAYYWLAQMQSPYGDLVAADMLIDDRNVTAANSLYNAITSTYKLPDVEATEFGVWGRKLMDVRANLVINTKQLSELSSAQLATLDSVATYATMWAQVRAQNWLSLYDGRIYDRTFLFPEGDDGPRARKANVEKPKPAGYKVYPNPVSEYLSVSYADTSDKGAIMQITDAVGRIVMEAALEGPSGNAQIDVRSLQFGIYLYHIIENGKTVQNGKLTKQ